jgi:hypothetical protein
MATILSLLGLVLDGLPLTRTVWRWLLERQMEVRVEPLTDYVIQYAVPDERNKIPDIPVIHVNLRLTFINHRTDRHERIIDCNLLLKHRHLILWRRTFATVPMRAYASNRYAHRDWNIDLAPTSSPFTIEAEATVRDSWRDSNRYQGGWNCSFRSTWSGQFVDWKRS